MRVLPALMSIIFFNVSIYSGQALARTYSGLVVDMESERVLYERNADELRHPASLTKMMTLYLVFEALANGRIFTDTALRASRFAVSRAPSKLGFSAGDTISVEQGILGLVTRSANDAATVLAEGMAGSEPAFAEMMTAKARQLGMSQTLFRNASGLPDAQQVTTAWDMFRLAKALYKHFPQFYGYFSTHGFDFRGHNFRNHNHLLETYPGTDGIKTGFVNASGFNLVASATRNGHRLVGVVFGGSSAPVRDAHMRDILDDGFAQLDGAQPRLITASFDRPSAAPRLPSPEAEDARGLVKTSAREKDKSSARPQSNTRNETAWQLRVGEFPNEKAAEQRLNQAVKAAPFHLRHAHAAVSPRPQRGKKTYIASFNGVDKDAADKACQALRQKRVPCSPIRMPG